MNYLPELSNIGNLLLEVVTVCILFALAQFKDFLLNWLEAHTTEKQRQTLHRFAQEAFSFAETVYASNNGPSKLAAATAYLSSRLKEKGITFTPDEIRASIEKACLDYKAATTQPKPADQPVITVEKPVIPPEVQQIVDAAKALASSQEAPAAAAVPQTGDQTASA